MPQNPFIKTDPNNPFRNDQNRLYGRELFLEFNTIPGVARYTLKDHDYQGCQSLKQLFLSARDTTEYLFANQYFDGWQHWDNIQKQAWMAPYVTQWRNELALLLEAEQIARLIKTSEGTSKEAFAAQKYLRDLFGKKAGPGRGRPSNEEIQKAARQIADESQTLAEEAERVFGEVLN